MKVLDVLFSMKTMLVLLFILAVACGAATFIENDYGPETARALVYNAKWFEVVFALLTLNFVVNIFTYRMWEKEKIFSFILHLSLVLILVGAVITRYFGYEGMMHIREGETVNYILSSETYVEVHHNGQPLEAWPVLISQRGKNDFTFSTSINGKDLKVSYMGHSGGRNKQLSALVNYAGETQTVQLIGGQGLEGIPVNITMGGENLRLLYGAMRLTLPFAVKLDNFVLERYPGSNSPASYSSYVEVIDDANAERFPFHIYMNHVLDHQGYRFYQSSYDQDELGTYLSVSSDPGKLPTYVGYFFLTLGIIVSLFMPQGRCRVLLRELSTSKAARSVAMLAAAILLNMHFTAPAHAFPEYANRDSAETSEQQANTTAATEAPATPRTFVRPPLPIPYQYDLQHAEKFGSLLVLDTTLGRIKPIDTYARELLYKIAKTVALDGFTPNQVILGMMVDPFSWQFVNMIRVEHPQLRRVMNLFDDKQRRTSFASFFSDVDGSYVLQPYVEAAYQKDPSFRNTFDRGVIAVDERVSIAYMIYAGLLWNFFPHQEGTSNTWYTINDAMEQFPENERRDVMGIFSRYFTAVEHGIASGNWTAADAELATFKQYQREHDNTSAIPAPAKVSAEVLLNKLSIFKNVTFYYLLTGFVLLLGAFYRMFFAEHFLAKKGDAKLFRYFQTGMLGLIWLGFIAQTIGLGLRWYVSGYAPMSNSYESMIYIGWASVLAGLMFYRTHVVSAPAAAIMGSIALMVAHLTDMNPQITNLVPVLKSYWLTYHVAVITASYGFFGLSLMLGMIVLLFYAFRSPKRPHIDGSIRDMMALNQVSMIVGLGLFTIGNFLGAVWANESWGRYWGWDPKETWSLIIILIYSLVIHLGVIPKLKWNLYPMAIGSVLAFSTVLMTYFGVNFYLAGMHSYAGGDPVPIPGWVAPTLAAIAFLILIAFPKRDAKFPLADPASDPVPTPTKNKK
ncbi:cytochrome c biogenesis protein CcsA [Chrysiogenes arsenatis]|uniref:cytochrome c biogenesis protein CcsA n=1 Tax=Chrysiogenes arsenatis TaxID=309797 RepID=UPI000411AEE9|nr:cytochrome c biogenesis protein CcsA [Chrysiogenes arsenatis]